MAHHSSKRETERIRREKALLRYLRSLVRAVERSLTNRKPPTGAVPAFGGGLLLAEACG